MSTEKSRIKNYSYKKIKNAGVIDLRFFYLETHLNSLQTIKNSGYNRIAIFSKKWNQAPPFIQIYCLILSRLTCLH